MATLIRREIYIWGEKQTRLLWILRYVQMLLFIFPPLWKLFFIKKVIYRDFTEVGVPQWKTLHKKEKLDAQREKKKKSKKPPDF